MHNNVHVSFESVEKQVHSLLNVENVDYKEVVKTLSNLQDSKISVIIDSLDKETALKILDNFENKNDLAQVILWLNPVYITHFIEKFGTDEFISVVKFLPYEEIAALIEDLNEGLQHKLLHSFTGFARKNIEMSLSYPEDSIARIMSKDMVTIPWKWTVGQALDYISSLGEDGSLPEVFYEVYVVDAAAKFVGVVRLNKLIGSFREKSIESLHDKETKALKFSVKKEVAAQLFKEKHLASLPIVDETGFLIGTVHVDSMVDVIYTQYEEDMLMMAGIDNRKSMRTLFSVASSRLKWLMVNILGGLVVIPIIVGLFEATLSQKIILAALIPVVNSIGGNIGLQTLSITLRGMTNNIITSITVKKHVYKEVSIVLTNSLIVGVIGAVASYMWDGGDIRVGILIFIAIAANAFCGMGIGIFFPLMFKKLKLDPAIASTLMLTTATDLLGFVIVLGLGAYILT